jgi:hypothetical protein
MLYVPRHFFINNHLAVEAALGREAYAQLLYEAGYRSAFSWCEQEAETHGLGGFDVFRHYMRRLSQRGWGQFAVQRLDEAAGVAVVRVDHSTFVEAYAPGQATEPGEGGGSPRLCYMFAGWFPGALTWAGRNLGRSPQLIGEELRCGAEAGQDHCLFETRAAQR